MPNSSFDEIIEDFEFLDDWEDRYRYIIELGKKMSPLESAMKVASTKVDGCASQVWIVPKISGSGDMKLFNFIGDSDAMIVRGLIAILSALYSNITVKEAIEIDANVEFRKLGLTDHLSAQRSNGLNSMIQRLKLIAINEND
jgi:cysteine desulfuration protein SufE|tara:strand:+ start:606 stop:1031 length:426 start_codon:yes stop_codon:yes gene_type:complete